MDTVPAIDRLCARVHLGLREGAPDPDDVVELACELLDWGHSGAAVREVVERDPAQVSGPEMAALARRILDETGFVPGFELAPERLETLRQALATAARDLPTAGVEGEPRLVPLADRTPESVGVELADGRVLVGGSALQAPMGRTRTDALTAVAELIQESLMERDRRVWPLCPDHGRGLHPRPHEGTAVWWCTGTDGHPVSPIGELPRSRGACG